MSLTLVDHPVGDSELQQLEDCSPTRSCLVCCDPTGKDNTSDSENVQSYLLGICEVVGVQGVEADDILKKFWNSDDIVFCQKCRLNLKMFREIQFQLQSLNEELANVRSKLSQDLRNSRDDIKSSVGLRTCLINEFEVRQGAGPASHESILGNLENCDKWIDVTDFYDSPIENDSSVPNDDLLAQWDLKPCLVKLHRVNGERSESDIVSFDGERKRRRKKRLKNLLKRQEVKKRGRKAHKKIKEEDENDLSEDGRKKGYKRVKTTKCPSCPLLLRSEEFLGFHIRKIHKGHPLPYNCYSCEAEFDLLSSLRGHEYKTGHHSPGSNQGIECELCHRIYCSPEKFEAHLERQGGECKRELLPENSTFDRTQKKSQRFICGDCGKKFRSPHHLRIHIRGSHTDGFAFLCEFCSKPFKVKQTMINHQRVVHLEQLLPMHKNVDALLEKVKELTCEICQVRFTNHSCLKKHSAKAHTKKVDFYCEVCGSGWVTKAALERHTVVHTQERQFPCTQCDLKFTRNDKLKRHVKVKHGDGSERKFICDYCPKAFFDNPARQRHMDLVHSERGNPSIYKFRCDVCKYNCITKDYLRIHQRSRRHLANAAAFIVI